jgi:putative ABC transport system permease protein
MEPRIRRPTAIVSPLSVVSPIPATFRSALEVIWSNRWRSLLTTLGILIGVAAVVAALTLTQGVNGYITKSISNLGTNTIIVFPGTTQNRGTSQGPGQSLTLSDEQSLIGLPHVASVSPLLVLWAQAIYGDEHWSTTINGTNVDDLIIQNWTVAQGAWFTQQEDQHGVAVAVIGDTVAHNLFDATNTNPIGQQILIRDQIFTVIGVLAVKGQGQDDVIYVPFNTAHLRLHNVTYINQILVMADTIDNVPVAQQNIIDQLAKDHQQKDPSSYDFQVSSFAQILQGAQRQTRVITFLLGGIAVLSLTVGGIGIMNSMLVLVTERTREIGLRIAVGARRSDIRNQFLVEALVLCLISAGLGLLLGLLVGWGLTAFFAMPFVVTPTTIVVPVGVSFALTSIFGIYPAIRAARLDPIEALLVS